MPTQTKPTQENNTDLRLKHVVFGTDFSDGSRRALPLAIAFCERVGARMSVVHVVVPDFAREPFDSIQRQATAEQKMAEFTARADFDAVPCESAVLQGSSLLAPWQRFVKGQYVDLAIVASRARSGVEKMFIGSVAEVIVRHSSVPVMIVGPNVLTDRVQFKSVLLALELCEQDRKAARTALKLVDALNANLRILHVCWDANGSAHPTDNLKALLPAMTKHCDPSCRRAAGPPALQIVVSAADERAELIVLPMRRTDGAPDWTVLADVVQSARCPVLAVRCSKEES
jgi:nucleotide-binding universal stress UspA family protein